MAPTQEAPVSKAVPLWPAPVLVLGIAALVAVYLCRPLRDVDTHHRARDLGKARELLAQPDGDLELALELAERAHKLGAGRGEATFLAGSAHVRLAEQRPDQAARHWAIAREYLESVEAKGLTSEEDRIALAYALARLDFHEGRVAQSITRLEACAEQVEPKGRAEAYDLLTRAYLRLSPPDLDRAISANERLRQSPDLSGPDMAAAQLTGGELLLRMGKPREARKELELIKEQYATPAVLVRARLLLGRCHQDEKPPQYDLAVKRYLAALKDSRASVPQPAQVYYNLGLCYSGLSKPQEAAAAWKECVRLSQAEPQETNSMQAASIVLAELDLLPPNAPNQSTIEHLRRAVQRVGKPEDWKNPLLDLSRARQVYENAIALLRQTGHHELALKALEPYVRLAPSRRAVELRGQLSWEWARARREKAPSPGGALDGETQKLFAQAAAAFAQAAELPQLTPKEVAEHLWSAASCHLAAGEGKPATEKLERLVRMDLEPARLGEAWYLLGEERRNANAAKEAELAYQECLKYVTRFAYLARYQLAMAALNRGEIDVASESLKFNLGQLTQWDPDAEATSQTLFALCGLLYRQAKYREVVRYYERALGQFAQRFEAAGTLLQARLQLANSYRQIASQANVQYFLQENQSAEARAHFQREHHQWLKKAAEEFATLDELLETPAGQTAQGLTADERNQVPFLAAKCWFNLGQYDKALTVYERLIARYEGKAEGLDALGGAVSCHAALGQVSKVGWRLVQIEKTIEDMPAEIRDPWKRWLEEARKGLEGIKES